MSKVYCNFKFDNEELKEEFIKLLPNIAPDIASFLKGGLEVKGIVSDPEIVVDSEKEVIKVNMFAGNKGNVLVMGDKTEYLDHSTLPEDAIYALFNARTKNLELFVKRDPVDIMIQQYSSFKGLDENWRTATVPPKPEALPEETDDAVVMEIVPDEEPQQEDE
jgi:hypothetical protein